MRVSLVSSAVFAMCCFLAVTVPSLAASAREWPLWDGHESVADYAKKVNLPATKSIDLGGGVMLDLVLIPAGQFVMGTAEPPKLTITIAGAQALLIVGGVLVLVLLLFLIFKKRKERRFSFSLGWLVLFTAAGGLLVGGVARWHLAVQEAARYEAEKAVYDEVRIWEMRAHPVTLSQPFYMGKYTVTQAQYEALVGGNPSHFKGAQLPVEQVSWGEATAFCVKLTERLWDKALESRLPTEAQWEYACRAGTTTAYYSGNQESDLDAVAWYQANSQNTTHPVGAKKPNAFGLYDMHGNVWQWCADAWKKDDEARPAVDPFNDKGASRVLRGGSWGFYPRGCRSAFRYSYDPDIRSYYFGFRVVCVPSSRTP